MPNQDPQQNKLTREEQEKGGQHSQQSENQGNRMPPSKEDAAKGGQHSHSGGNR